MNQTEDPMWLHFRPLWSSFEQLGIEGLRIAGGYGLFLKQNWLSLTETMKTVVSVTEWKFATPRATKDVDLIIGLALIAEERSHVAIMQALTENGYQVGEKPNDKRWKFQKRTQEGGEVIVELHAPEPKHNDKSFSTDKFRVKHRPSLGKKGIHGRINPEACGAMLHPFTLEKDETKLALVNPVTWSVMKLTAARDRWDKSRDPNLTDELREFHQSEALKHTQDVYRIVSMTTQEEMENISTVIAEIHEEESFQVARSIVKQNVLDNDLSNADIRRTWEEKDIATIREVLSDWFF